MRIVTYNVNGIRAAARKGFFDWLSEQDADFVCLQEIKAEVSQLSDPIFWPKDYHVDYVSATSKKGYSGVAIYSKYVPNQKMCSVGFEPSDSEGRYLAYDFSHFRMASIYVPSGTSGDSRQTVKMQYLSDLFAHLQQMADMPYILCGDVNIAHKTGDIKNWRSNQNHSGFLPEERAWVDRLLDDLHYRDAFRTIQQAPDQYTWWSNRGQARAKNVGWRIDYQLLSPAWQAKVLRTEIYTDNWFSDHAPLIIDYDDVL